MDFKVKAVPVTHMKGLYLMHIITHLYTLVQLLHSYGVCSGNSVAQK